MTRARGQPHYKATKNMEFQTYDHNGKTYYDIFEIRDHGKNLDETFFRGSKNKDKRSLWVKRMIPSEVLIRVYKGELSNFSRATYFVEEEFINANCYAHEVVEQNAVCDAPPKQIKPFRFPVLDPPPIIKFDPKDVGFKSGYVVMLNIEARGERTKGGIFFKANDVQKHMGMPRIYATLTNKNTSFVHNKHYVYFSRKLMDNNIHGNHSAQELYLTFEGLITLLYRTRSYNYVERWQSWANDVLFVNTFDAQNHAIDKQEYASLKRQNEILKEQLDMEINLRKKTIECCNLKFADELNRVITNSCKSGVYLILIGSVKMIREFNDTKLERLNASGTMNEILRPIDVTGIDDDQLIYKFGKSSDIHRRWCEHLDYYGKWSPCEFSLKKIAFIDFDERRLSGAEDTLRQEFEHIRHRVTHYNELIIFNEAQAPFVNDVFRRVADDNHCDMKVTRERLEHTLESHDSEVGSVKAMHALELDHVRQQLKYEKMMRDMENEIQLSRSSASTMYDA